MHPQSVHQAFERTATRSPEAEFLFVDSATAAVYALDPGPIRYGEAAQRVEALRLRYREAGYGRGHRVGLLLENRPAFFHHWFALNALGASVVPISAEMRRAEWLYLIAHSEMCLAVSLPERAAALAAAAAEAGASMPVMPPDQADAIPPAPRIAAPGSPAGAPGAKPLGAECALLYTSGTTGMPKGCRLNNAYFLNCGSWYLGMGGLCAVRPGAERVVTPLPLSHMNAMAFSTMMAVMSGGCIVQLDRFHPNTWWRSVSESRATIVHYLGVMPAMLLCATATAEERAHRVRFGFGAGVDPGQHRPFEERFGFPLLEAWAMTETGAAAAVIAGEEPRYPGTRCFGRPGPAMEIRLVDDTGAEVAGSQAGELWVRSAGPEPRRNFFSGYLKDDEATEEAWAQEWFHTGDVVRRDTGGSLYFIDRKKNVIRRSGENISAVEVESVLNQHPRVKASAVAAAPDPVRGDEVLACIVTNEPCPAVRQRELAADIVNHALAQLAYFKAPAYVAFVESLPLTSSQKIQRAGLRDLARTLPGQDNCFDLRSMKKRSDPS